MTGVGPATRSIAQPLFIRPESASNGAKWVDRTQGPDPRADPSLTGMSEMAAITELREQLDVFTC